MNIFQLAKKARRAKSALRAAAQQAERNQASKSYDEKKDNQLHAKIAAATRFLNAVDSYVGKQKELKAVRSSLPKKQQRKLGLIP